MNEISTARSCHKSIPAKLADSLILLSATHSVWEPLLHTLPSPQSSSNPELEAQIRKHIDEIEAQGADKAPLSASVLAVLREQLQRARVGSVETEAEQWFGLRHHYLLRSLMARGDVPRHWPEYMEQPGISEPQSLKNAFQEAMNTGFRIPERFLEDSPDTSYGEKEAFYAACEFAANRWTFELAEDETELVRKVLQLSSSFVIPNDKPGCAPYVADQLWIVEGPSGSIRLIILEIDGEYHLEPGAAERDKLRDKYFNSLGYEVYRVAGWWARIDPFRVIGEFLAEAIGLRSIKAGLEFTPPSITDYRCFACGEPMVRWDDRWIERDYRYKYDEALDSHESDTVFVHRQCVQE